MSITTNVTTSNRHAEKPVWERSLKSCNPFARNEVQTEPAFVLQFCDVTKVFCGKGSLCKGFSASKLPCVKLCVKASACKSFCVLPSSCLQGFSTCCLVVCRLSPEIWSQNCPHIETFDTSDLFPRIGLPIISTCLLFVALLFSSCLLDLSDVVPPFAT